MDGQVMRASFCRTQEQFTQSVISKILLLYSPRKTIFRGKTKERYIHAGNDTFSAYQGGTHGQTIE
jgi:hypothetical protein